MVELMHDIAPSVRRVAMLYDPRTANTGVSAGIYLPSMKAAAIAATLNELFVHRRVVCNAIFDLPEKLVCILRRI